MTSKSFPILYRDGRELRCLSGRCRHLRNKQTNKIGFGSEIGIGSASKLFFLELDLNEGGYFFWPDAIRVADQQTQNRLPSKKLSRKS